jgi:predicted hydrolase (HD superfamily)
VRKKMKDKAFARGVSREQLLRSASEMGIEFDDLVGEVVAAMTANAKALGLAGSESP